MPVGIVLEYAALQRGRPRAAGLDDWMA